MARVQFPVSETFLGTTGTETRTDIGTMTLILRLKLGLALEESTLAHDSDWD